jgi:hypothetical protein
MRGQECTDAIPAIGAPSSTLTHKFLSVNGRAAARCSTHEKQNSRRPETAPKGHNVCGLHSQDGKFLRERRAPTGAWDALRTSMTRPRVANRLSAIWKQSEGRLVADCRYPRMAALPTPIACLAAASTTPSRGPCRRCGEPNHSTAATGHPGQRNAMPRRGHGRRRRAQ